MAASSSRNWAAQTAREENIRRLERVARANYEEKVRKALIAAPAVRAPGGLGGTKRARANYETKAKIALGAAEEMKEARKRARQELGVAEPSENTPGLLEPPEAELKEEAPEREEPRTYDRGGWERLKRGEPYGTRYTRANVERELAPIGLPSVLEGLIHEYDVPGEEQIGRTEKCRSEYADRKACAAAFPGKVNQWSFYYEDQECFTDCLFRPEELPTRTIAKRTGQEKPFHVDVFLRDATWNEDEQLPPMRFTIKYNTRAHQHEITVSKLAEIGEQSPDATAYPATLDDIRSAISHYKSSPGAEVAIFIGDAYEDPRSLFRLKEMFFLPLDSLWNRFNKRVDPRGRLVTF